MGHTGLEVKSEGQECFTDKGGGGQLMKEVEGIGFCHKYLTVWVFAVVIIRGIIVTKSVCRIRSTRQLHAKVALPMA